MDELDRRLDFYAKHGIPIDVAQVITNMQEELSGSPSLDRLHARNTRPRSSMTAAFFRETTSNDRLVVLCVLAGSG